ncbi:MAG: triose-phosphate isomerase [Victivallales bacterium]|nr:triose-phosphate isomerase [Victivallales bacterium]
MARRKLIAGNWKMNMTSAEGAQLIKDIKAQFGAECPCTAVNKPDVLVCPPFTSIAAVIEAAKGTCFNVGAQNIHWEEKGAYTGEISGNMLNELGVTYVIIGHSERRQYFGETDDTVNKRTKAALKHNIKPVICVGETLKQRQAGETLAVIENQVRAALKDLTAEDMKNVTIAYEPVWAIGSGLAATNEDAQEVHAMIRGLLKKLYEGTSVADETRILYGGSMNDANAAGLLAQPDIDGGLIGGAALKPDKFAVIIKAALGK